MNRRAAGLGDQAAQETEPGSGGQVFGRRLDLCRERLSQVFRDSQVELSRTWRCEILGDLERVELFGPGGFAKLNPRRKAACSASVMAMAFIRASELPGAGRGQ